MTGHALPTVARLDALVDVVNDALFSGTRLSQARCAEWGDALAERQGGSWAYADSFELTADERSRGVVLFTGERIQSASARHILGQECCRALLKMPHKTPRARAALARASRGLAASVVATADREGHPGRFCCAKCSVALWRHLAAGGFDAQERRLEDGIAFLSRCRDGSGRWQRFPFFYTVLALSEIDTEPARNELRYVAPVLEAKLLRKPASAATSQRRRAVMRRALESLG